jgi:DNA-binding response OmpR family regulator
MARLLIVKPETSFHTLFHAVLAQAGYVAIEAANSYERRPAADVVCLADGRRDRRAPARARLLIVEAAAQFHAFFCEVLAQAGYVVTEAVNSDTVQSDAGRAADMLELRYVVVY